MLRLLQRTLLPQDVTCAVAEISENIDADYREVFTGETGERVLRHMMLGAMFWEHSFDPDAHCTSFNEGRRAVVLDILNRIRRKRNPVKVSADYTEALDFDYRADDKGT